MSVERHQIERKWIEANAERDRCREESRLASRSGDVDAFLAARARLKEARDRCNSIMSDYQTLVALEAKNAAAPPPREVKPVREAMVAEPEPKPVKSRQPDPVQEIVDGLSVLIPKAEAAKLVLVAKLLTLAKDQAADALRPA
jgi:hypothetical protein